MKYWLISSNNKRFHLDDYLTKHDIIDWKQGRFKYKTGDFVFIYSSIPDSSIKYVLCIEQTNLTYDETIDDSAYWGNKIDLNTVAHENCFFRMRLLGHINTPLLNFNALHEHGLKAAPQSAQILTEPLLTYITDIFSTYIDIKDQEIDSELYEGARTTIQVNKYERSPIARERCIQLKGTTCAVCGMNFEDTYGEVGKGFIHIHHIVPISSIGQNYQIDYEHDLIPVCPNCHAMLHRKINGKTLSIEELKSSMKNKKSNI